MAARGNALETHVAARLSAGMSGDTNAARDFSVAPAGDFAAYANLRLQGEASVDRARGNAAYTLGSRQFLRLPSESLAAHGLEVQGAVWLARALAAGVEAAGRDRRGGGRSYSDLSGRVFLELVPDSKVDGRVSAGPRRFLYWQNFPYSFTAIELSGQGRYRFGGHALVAQVDFGQRRHRGPARGSSGSSTALRWSDAAFAAGAGYGYRGGFLFNAAYRYQELASNSFGETILQHRLTVNGAHRIPLGWTLLWQAAAQLSSYPDGVFLAEGVALLEDEESHNSAQLKLSHPLADALDLEVSYAIFHNQLPQNRLVYARQVGAVGLTFRL